LRFGVELAANLLAGNAPDRWIEAQGVKLAEAHLASRGAVEAVQRLDLVDGWKKLRVVLETSMPMEVWRAPIETVSTSESGFERVYQGSSFLFLTPPLQPGTFCRFRLSQRVDAA
jgi:alpha-amylase